MCWGRSSKQIVYIIDMTNALWGCQDKPSCSLQSALCLKNEVGTNQIFFWRKNTYCWCQNLLEERWLTYNPEDVSVVARTKGQCSRVVFSEGDIMPTHFFKKREIVTKEIYVRVLMDVVKPWIETVASGIICFSAGRCTSSYMSHLIQNWFSENIDMFWSKEFWPPNSPDLNLLDYYVVKLKGSQTSLDILMWRH